MRFLACGEYSLAGHLTGSNFVPLTDPVCDEAQTAGEFFFRYDANTVIVDTTVLYSLVGPGVVEVTPVEDLVPFTKYNVKIDHSAFADIRGNPNEEIVAGVFYTTGDLVTESARACIYFSS